MITCIVIVGLLVVGRATSAPREAAEGRLDHIEGVRVDDQRLGGVRVVPIVVVSGGAGHEHRQRVRLVLVVGHGGEAEGAIPANCIVAGRHEARLERHATCLMCPAGLDVHQQRQRDPKSAGKA